MSKSREHCRLQVSNDDGLYKHPLLERWKIKPRNIDAELDIFLRGNPLREAGQQGLSDLDLVDSLQDEIEYNYYCFTQVSIEIPEERDALFLNILFYAMVLGRAFSAIRRYLTNERTRKEIRDCIDTAWPFPVARTIHAYRDQWISELVELDRILGEAVGSKLSRAIGDDGFSDTGGRFIAAVIIMASIDRLRHPEGLVNCRKYSEIQRSKSEWTEWSLGELKEWLLETEKIPTWMSDKDLVEKYHMENGWVPYNTGRISFDIEYTPPVAVEALTLARELLKGHGATSMTSEEILSREPFRQCMFSDEPLTAVDRDRQPRDVDTQEPCDPEAIEEESR